eukprot:5140065-Alexandrium_andersonii.AAC.1
MCIRDSAITIINEARGHTLADGKLCMGQVQGQGNGADQLAMAMRGQRSLEHEAGKPSTGGEHTFL